MIRPGEIWKIIVRHRWFIIIPFCLSIIVGIYFAFSMPKLYEASTLILVEPQRVPSNYVQSVVTVDITSRLRTIAEQVMSRTNIERIIDAYKLYPDIAQNKMFIEEKVEAVRGLIGVNVKQSSTFTISFRGKEPEKVKNVANALATYFIDENLKVREAQAVGTSAFLSDELKSLRSRLEEKEDKLREYRKAYMGELPDQLNANLAVLTRFGEQLIAKQQALREAKAVLASAEKQLSESQNAQSNMPAFDESLLGDGEGSGNAEIDAMKQKLSELKMRYKDQHPDVLRLKAMIEKMEAEQAEKAKGAGSGEAGEKETELPKIDYMSLQRTQLSENRRQIALMETDIADLEKKIQAYQERVENTPKREEALMSIQRDYDNIKGIYQSMLQRELEAEVSVNMEKKQKGEQFRIIDPARLPEKPVSPNLNRLFLMSIGIGLAVGGGIVFLLEFLDNSFRKKEDLETSLGLPVLATVPVLLHPIDNKRQKMNFILTMVFICFSLMLTAGFAIVIQKGPDRVIEAMRRIFAA